MSKFSPNQDNVYQLISGQLAGQEFAKPSYFNNTVYYITAPSGMPSKVLPITNARLAATPSSQSSNSFPYPGTTPTISPNGIVWAVEKGSTAVLHAYDTSLRWQQIDTPGASAGILFA